MIRRLVWGLSTLALVSCGPPSGKTPEQSGAARERRCVLLLTMDTLPAFQVGCYGAPAARTPSLDRLARRGLQVRDAISVAPITLPSHGTMLTGLRPPEHGLRENGIFRLGPEITTVPELLPAEIGKAAFVGAFPLDSRFGLDQGFSVYSNAPSEVVDGNRRPERKADEVFRSAFDWISQSNTPQVFLWAHVFDPHYPYDPPAPWLLLARNKTFAELQSAEIAFTDHEVGRFVRNLEALAGAGNFTCLVTSDHGESLGAHKEITHSIFIYDATQRVPLIAFGPDFSPRFETGQRSLVDIAPTILRVFQVGAPQAWPGKPLQESQATQFAWVESMNPELYRGWSSLFGVRTSDWKYIQAPRPELYDLVRDPGETTNQYGSRPDVAEELRKRVEEVLKTASPSETAPVESEDLEKLRSLGYVAEVEPGRSPSTGKDPKDGIEGAAALFHAQKAYLEGDLPRSESLLRRTIQLDPDCKEAYAFLAGTYYGLQRYAQSVEYARRALELPPRLNEGPVYMTLGESLLALRRYQEAVAPLERAVELLPASKKAKSLLLEARTPSG